MNSGDKLKFVDLDGFNTDITYTNRFSKEIIQLASQALISGRIASSYEDMKQATDYVCTPKFKDIDLTKHVAGRVRRAGQYSEKYRYEITIRSFRKSGTETELSKLMRGCADIMVYAHAKTDEPPVIGIYHVLNLNVLRDILTEYKNGGRKFRWSEHENKDRTTKFIAIDLRSIYDVDKLVIMSNDMPKYNPSLKVGKI